MGDGFDKAGEIVSHFSALYGNLLKIPSVVTRLLASDWKNGEKDYKHWFLYRFLDEDRSCPTVEWNISKSVVHQYGPALRGCIMLAFHGNPAPKKQLRLLLRPRISFKDNSMNYDPPKKQPEDANPVELAISPVEA